MIDFNTQVLEAWDTHQQMFWLLFDAIEPDAFAGKPTGMSGRSVGNIFAHLNNLRIDWMKASAPELIDGLMRIPVKSKAERESIRKDQLRPALEKSGAAMRRMFAGALDKGKLKGHKTPIMTMYSYMIAHEWYHIGEVGMTLTLSGHKLPEQAEWGIWSWGRWTPGGAAPKSDE
ncbi:MAG: hypothetical protein GC204_13440 [Chloroflexi bacterium]|nr:hypothetical protein [Chloroflexota bacterium]